MSILQRLVDVTKAAAHEALNKLEDPVMMLNHYSRQMEEELEEARAALLREQATALSMQRRQEEYTRMAEHAENAASSALAEGREQDARAALSDKIAIAAQAEQHQIWKEEASSRAVDLEGRIQAAEAELQRMHEKREELVQRAGKAAFYHQAPYNNCTFDGRDAARGFRRMEEKIIQREAEAEQIRAFRPGADCSGFSPYHTAYRGAEADQRDNRIDVELEKLRQSLASSESSSR
ncbi:PspA/IM30 family protein [Paenibacillus tarimensis]|uniref:PspA/IM30 family protein n=1 Tax=Paenibacillus tarimensis TaxID=416012 RepID=UPI001F313646|nr:PspA/IM30 family protein [Paenibacillus tarimensis]MCF2945052.1 PspA/IM30 family protein [Paenibacillus tarimensis]